MILCGVPSHPANPCSTRYARRLGGRHCCDVMLAHRGRIDRQIRKFTPILGDNLSPSSPFVIYLCHHFCHPKEPLILRHYKGTSDDWNKDWYLSEVTLPPSVILWEAWKNWKFFGEEILRSSFHKTGALVQKLHST